MAQASDRSTGLETYDTWGTLWPLVLWLIPPGLALASIILTTGDESVFEYVRHLPGLQGLHPDEKPFAIHVTGAPLLFALHLAFVLVSLIALGGLWRVVPRGLRAQLAVPSALCGAIPLTFFAHSMLDTIAAVSCGSFVESYPLRISVLAPLWTAATAAGTVPAVWLIAQAAEDRTNRWALALAAVAVAWGPLAWLVLMVVTKRI